MILSNSNYLEHRIVRERTLEITGLIPYRKYLGGRSELICSTIKIKTSLFFVSVTSKSQYSSSVLRERDIRLENFLKKESLKM